VKEAAAGAVETMLGLFAVNALFRETSGKPSGSSKP